MKSDEQVQQELHDSQVQHLANAIAMSDLKYYPCIYDDVKCTMSRIVGRKTTKEKAERFLKNNYLSQWLIMDARAAREDEDVLKVAGGDR